MVISVIMFIKETNKRECNTLNDSKNNTSIIPAFASANVPAVFVGSSNVHLHTSKGKESAQNAPDSIEHYKLDEIADHWELVVSLFKVAFSLVLFFS